ncbi:hypothetical protein GCM10009583_03260 [Ornithinicoccus hortensis]
MPIDPARPCNSANRIALSEPDLVGAAVLVVSVTKDSFPLVGARRISVGPGVTGKGRTESVPANHQHEQSGYPTPKSVGPHHGLLAVDDHYTLSGTTKNGFSRTVARVRFLPYHLAPHALASTPVGPWLR